MLSDYPCYFFNDFAVCITSKNKTERDVYMFHYTQWPDHGVPEPLSLVVFHRHVIKTAAKHPMGYIIVNCRYFVTTFLCHLYTFYTIVV